MKNLTLKTSLRIAMGVLVLLSVTTASAATDGRFNIPFQFLMGDKVLPAGDYNVKIDTAEQTDRIDFLERLGRRPSFRQHALAGRLRSGDRETRFPQVRERDGSSGDVEIRREVWPRVEALEG